MTEPPSFVMVCHTSADFCHQWLTPGTHSTAMPHPKANPKELTTMPLLPHPADNDLLPSPALAAGVLVLPALATLGLSAVLALAAPTSHGATVPAQKPQGSLHSGGGASRNADGSVEQARSTTATSAATGNSVQTQSSYSKGSGLSRSATCYDASGTAMACPTRP